MISQGHRCRKVLNIGGAKVQNIVGVGVGDRGGGGGPNFLLDVN